MDMTGATFRVQILEATASLIIAAFGLVAALAWNGAIQAIIKEVFGSADDILGMLVYAIIVTVLAVTMTLLITNAIKKAKILAGIEDKE